MIVTTDDTVYRIVGKGKAFAITKVAALKSNSQMTVGQTITSNVCSIIVGNCLVFNDGGTAIYTKTVTHVEG